MTGRFDGNVVVVTGAAGGIGLMRLPRLAPGNPVPSRIGPDFVEFLTVRKEASRSPRSQAACSSCVVISQSGRMRRVTSRRSDHKSALDGRPQYQ